MVVRVEEPDDEPAVEPEEPEPRAAVDERMVVPPDEPEPTPTDRIPVEEVVEVTAAALEARASSAARCSERLRLRSSVCAAVTANAETPGRLVDPTAVCLTLR